MNKLYNKIYEASNAYIQKALIITDDQSNDSSVKFHNKEMTADFIPYELRTVDLGLSVLWCEYNIGAYPSNNPKDWDGDFYAWGETSPKKEYNENNYKYYQRATYVKYDDFDKMDTLGPIDDVAYNYNNALRMPTVNECAELAANTSYTWMEDYNGINGLNGILLTSIINGRKLFFPGTGFFVDNKRRGENTCCNIWTSSLNDRLTCFAYRLRYDQNGYNLTDNARYKGYSVRGVMNKNG